ncbi:MAG: NADH-quinone oxidoreductase subunit D [Holosporales bacterium]|jgi:NADH-quinone oxidoreductase subunit D|nr:NADH-quinone oxidoreductase subunit D [Holosporales bacterium]
MLNKHDDVYELNFGPHHPSTHGVLRLKLRLSGEEVLSCEPEIGYLCRNVEKIVESKKFLSIIPYIDRLDYLSPAIQEHAYVLAIEKLLKVHPPKRAVFIRTIFDELTRISSHIMAIGSMTYDLGCLSLFLYGFEEREKIMEIFDEVTGARMHISYYVPGGVFADVSQQAIQMIRSFLGGIDQYLQIVDRLALNNRIFIRRTKNIGNISKSQAIENGLSGVNLRASGIVYDVRNSIRYGAYKFLNFTPITLTGGDCYDRMKLRTLEVRQSVYLIEELLEILPRGDFCIEALWKKDIKIPEEKVIFSSTETPRGEFGIHMFVAENSMMPLRMHFKSPSFAHIQFLSKLLVGCKLPDIPAILGSMDFIMGCADR